MPTFRDGDVYHGLFVVSIESHPAKVHVKVLQPFYFPLVKFVGKSMCMDLSERLQLYSACIFRILFLNQEVILVFFISFKNCPLSLNLQTHRSFQMYKTLQTIQRILRRKAIIKLYVSCK
uniref:Uncharacterized protein n=1 Tax=Schistocephalus solidus TaxID=70667 RepID=A0A0X3P3W2_SCHSO